MDTGSSRNLYILWLKIKLRYVVQIKWEHSRYHTYTIPQIQLYIENVKINGFLLYNQEANRKRKFFLVLQRGPNEDDSLQIWRAIEYRGCKKIFCGEVFPKTPQKSPCLESFQKSHWLIPFDWKHQETTKSRAATGTRRKYRTCQGIFWRKWRCICQKSSTGDGIGLRNSVENPQEETQEKILKRNTQIFWKL